MSTKRNTQLRPHPSSGGYKPPKGSVTNPPVPILLRYACRCHASQLYDGLLECPGCHHRSYDPWCNSCERHQCGYVGLRTAGPEQAT